MSSTVYFRESEKKLMNLRIIEIIQSNKQRGKDRKKTELQRPVKNQEYQEIYNGNTKKRGKTQKVRKTIWWKDGVTYPI